MTESASRSFGVLSDQYFDDNKSIKETKLTNNQEDKIKALRNDLFINSSNNLNTNELKFNLVEGPLGKIPCIYMDWTASGRPLQSIENYFQKEIYPLYGNTHTTSSITGHQSTCFRHEARQIIAEATNAKITGRAAIDNVIFCGNGTTAAINKLVESFGLHVPLPYGFDDSYRPVIFTSSYEHHSNLLPWRESVADVVQITYNSVTGVCLDDLNKKLRIYSNRLLKIGSFAAASNITGILTAVDEVCIAMHQEGGYAIFDYATAAPYVHIDMNPVLINTGGNASLAYKDAVIFSGHKFAGGPGSPGVLIAKKTLLTPASNVPSTVGGGTVFYVTDEHHRYLSNTEEREEGGTPNILGDIRLGLVVRVKQDIGSRWIEQEELRVSEEVHSRLRNINNLLVLGRLAPDPIVKSRKALHLPIFSFLIRSGKRFLHHNFVNVLLNDLFGVQMRSGCMCAGPFSQTLLGLDTNANERIEMALLDKQEMVRPGYTRFSVPFWISSQEIDYVMHALTFVAEHGWKFLTMYRHNNKTGEWSHISWTNRFPARKWLSSFTLDDYALSGNDSTKPWSSTSVDTDVGVDLNARKVEVDDILSKVEGDSCKQLQKLRQQRSQANGLGLDDWDGLRWFALPGDPTSDDISDTTMNNEDSISSLSSVINPAASFDVVKISDISISSVSSSSVSASAYAQHRGSSKLRKQYGIQGHDKGDRETNRLPRYITIIKPDASLTPISITASRNEMKDSNIDTTSMKENDHTAVKAVVTKEITSGSNEDSITNTDDANDIPVTNVIIAAATKTITTSTMITSTDISPCMLPASTSMPRRGANAGSSFYAERNEKGQAIRKIPVANVPKKIMKAIGVAIKDWGMIEDGDRLLLGLSGGKDSMALLHALLKLQRHAPVKFEIACATVDPQTESFDPSPLIPYMQSLGVSYHFLSEPIVELAKSKMQGNSLCAFCSRFKRGLLYSCCRDHKYNKLVLAQHLDDLAESFLMSAFHGGQVRTMKANYTIEAGDVRVIRPLVYVREYLTRDFSKAAKLPIINENCPACFEEPKERHRVKKLLQQEESNVPELFMKLKRALIPLMHDDTYEVMDDIFRHIESRNQKRPKMISKRKQSSSAIDVNANETKNSGNTEKESENGKEMEKEQVKKHETQRKGQETKSESAYITSNSKKARYTCNDGLCFEIV